MAIVSMDFESQFIAGRHMINIILPDLPRDMDPRVYYPENEKLKVLWLLHGTFGDCTDWIRRTNIEVYACEKNIAVVMPSGLNSDYVNWKGFGVGFNMYDYLFEELMPMIYSWYPISRKREDNYIAGLSMGGFGAMVYALNRPEKFCAAASLSAPLYDPRKPLDVKMPRTVATPPHLAAYRNERRNNQIANCGSEEAFLASPANVWDKLISNVEEGVDLPKLYFCCGTKDFFYPTFQSFRAFAAEKNYPIVFEEEEGYGHEWRFWDKYIERFLQLYIPECPVKSLSF